VEYDSLDEVYAALDRDEISMAMMSEGLLRMLTNYRERPDFKVNIRFGYTFDSAFGFNNDEAILCSIIDKALDNIDTSEISRQWLSKTYDYRIKLTEAQRPWLISAVVLFLLLFVLMFILILIKNRDEKMLRIMMENVRAADAAKGDFVSNMSHEMRTPLNAIIGMTTIGKDTQDMERKNYALSKVEDASANLLGIINDVLDMAKIEANKLELSPVEFNIERMLQKVISIVKFRMDDKAQIFTLHVDAKVPHFIIGDDQRLSQVALNLLTNASKFTDENGEISLNITLEDEDDKFCKLRFEVSDNGIGISTAQQEKLFSAFSQAESGTSRNFGGTGLGLALSKRIVELMDGEIWVESELGKGAKFIFTIQASRGRQRLQSLLSPGISPENLNVLVVDDDKITLEFFKDVFSKINVKCRVASNGTEALRIIDENGDFDVYFIDWRLGEIDGIELTKRIKKRENSKDAIVTIISGLSTVVRDEGVKAGVNKYMMKPLFASAIIERINECLDVESARQEESFTETTRGEFGGKRVLLVEDIELNREILISLLNETGLIIDEAENGVEAIEKVTANYDKYDLVFMDIQMPRMDGLEATRQIRLRHKGREKHLPIIAMTANVFKDDIDRCLGAGMDSHIGKPLDLNDVLAVLKKYLS
jgi:signal transduction histidine kinase/CheY-like chemotaxis protein